VIQVREVLRLVLQTTHQTTAAVVVVAARILLAMAAEVPAVAILLKTAAITPVIRSVGEETTAEVAQIQEEIATLETAVTTKTPLHLLQQRKKHSTSVKRHSMHNS
jgi:hypothetical protein